MYRIIDKEKELIIHGHDPLQGIIIPSQEEIDFVTFIEDLEIEKRKYYLGPSTKEAALVSAKSFFNKKFKLHKIPYKGELRCDLDHFILKNIPGIEIPLRLHNITRYIHPFDLPTKFTSDNITDCMVVENVTFINSEEFFKRMKISFKEIILPQTITELTSSSYVHEITHTQLAHIKGIVKDYYNSEVLSIFLEILNVYEDSNSNKLLPLQDAVRLTELYQELYMLELNSKGLETYEESKLIDASKYSQSILNAYGLFVEYFYGSTNLRKYILNSIQNIFNGTLQLEELLSEFELTPNCVCKDEKVKKYFSR